ncbi:MAG: diaminopimelate epimerase [PS1 clade bacterium]|nr:diaminopimelate epimerase [PS1 clade bacterium]
MNTTTTIAFSKMNGLGNDFVIIDARDRDPALSPDNVRDLATRDNDTTKGCDQLLIIHPPKNGGDIFMQIFNADGSEVEACGNGTRAVAAYMARLGHSACLIDTLGGALACNSQSNGHYATAAHNVQVAMPLPKIGAAMSLHQDLPDALPVDVGNPHGVIFVATGTAGLAAQYGFQLERHAAFPQRANINFASLQGDNLIRLDTWERGVGLTKACGTGACATAVAAITQGLCAPGAVTVRPPYNQDDNAIDVLMIDYQPDTHLLMTGPVAHDFDAAVTL